MIWEEREAARAERGAAAAEGRVELETAIAEQRRLMAELFELKLELAEEKKNGWVLPEVSPGLLDYVVYPEVPSKVLYREVLLLEATVSPTQVEQRFGLTTGGISNRCGKWVACLFQTLHVREPQRVAEMATAELWRYKGKMMRNK